MNSDSWPSFCAPCQARFYHLFFPGSPRVITGMWDIPANPIHNIKDITFQPLAWHSTDALAEVYAHEVGLVGLEQVHIVPRPWPLVVLVQRANQYINFHQKTQTSDKLKTRHHPCNPILIKRLFSVNPRTRHKLSTLWKQVEREHKNGCPYKVRVWNAGRIKREKNKMKYVMSGSMYNPDTPPQRDTPPCMENSFSLHTPPHVESWKAK